MLALFEHVKLGIHVVLCCLSLLSSPAVAQDRALQQAERAEQRGQRERAWRILARAAARRPEDGRAAIRLAALLPQDPAEVAQPIERARAVEAALSAHLDAAGESVAARRALGWAVAAHGDHARAIESIAGLAGLQDVESAALLSRLAAVAVLRDDLAAAERALEAAHRALPQDNTILSDLGAVELARGDPSSAADRFSRILGRQPDDLGARRDLAGALVASGRTEEAVALLEQAVTVHPEEPELRLELARAALEAGQAIVAERAARGVIPALADDDGRGHSALGAALAAQRRRSEAELAFAEALRRNPRDTRARQALEALQRER